mgnify:CR=1 FL=1
MAQPLDAGALDVIFREARTHSAWLPPTVDDDLLKRVYDLAALGPTSANTCPMRVVFVKSDAAKAKGSDKSYLDAVASSFATFPGTSVYDKTVTYFTPKAGAQLNKWNSIFEPVYQS